MRVLAEHRTQMKVRLHQKDVPVLQILPHDLRSQIELVAYAPFLTAHSLFKFFWDELSPCAMRIARECLEEVTVHAGQKVFGIAEDSLGMYFLCEGALNYNGSFGEDQQCTQSHWIAEATLWLQSWQHTGNAVAETALEVLLLNRNQCCAVMRHEDTAWKYAVDFVDYCVKNPSLISDIHPDATISNKLVADIVNINCPDKGRRPSILSYFSLPELNSCGIAVHNGIPSAAVNERQRRSARSSSSSQDDAPLAAKTRTKCSQVIDCAAPAPLSQPREIW
eukprot:NODE_14009_length_1133_cov_13.736581.p1 GENE.NODE_14009_length_1133_cov_13.736581~~NODE_14009_length_1133_cov_13.736581.p1  ORF type:complete len:327 (+),score=44.03 NODE_14009_length_1133_cov_13.736581:145-981(+)